MPTSVWFQPYTPHSANFLSLTGSMMMQPGLRNLQYFTAAVIFQAQRHDLKFANNSVKSVFSSSVERLLGGVYGNPVCISDINHETNQELDHFFFVYNKVFNDFIQEKASTAFPTKHHCCRYLTHLSPHVLILCGLKKSTNTIYNGGLVAVTLQH